MCEPLWAQQIGCLAALGGEQRMEESLGREQHAQGPLSCEDACALEKHTVATWIVVHGVHVTMTWAFVKMHPNSESLGSGLRICSANALR